MTTFHYEPSQHVPFRDLEAIERVRKIPRSEIDKHDNSDYRIHVLRDEDVPVAFASDLFYRLKTAKDNNQTLVGLFPNPNPIFRHVARFCNQFNLDCKHLYSFNLDEYADQDGYIAPPDWKYGFMYAFRRFFINELRPELRPPEKQICGPTDANFADYGKMIEDLGGADICYSGPGWTGHLAFIDPDAPEFQAKTFEEWKQMGPRIVTLSPFTIAQNSLHGSFGKSGNLAQVPPKAATIGPKEVISAAHRVQTIAITVHGTSTSWQRLSGRLVMHGPVTPEVPESICQTLPTDVLLSETNAMDIEPDWEKQY